MAAYEESKPEIQAKCYL